MLVDSPAISIASIGRNPLIRVLAAPVNDDRPQLLDCEPPFQGRPELNPCHLPFDTQLADGLSDFDDEEEMRDGVFPNVAYAREFLWAALLFCIAG